jgi:hypothetical protein
VECPTATSTWKWGEELLNKQIPDQHKLFGNPIRANPKTKSPDLHDAITNAILGILQWTIWTHRNKVIFQGENPSPIQAQKQAIGFLTFFTHSLSQWIYQLKNPASSLYNPRKFYQYIWEITKLPRIFTITPHGLTPCFPQTPKTTTHYHTTRPPDRI